MVLRNLSLLRLAAISQYGHILSILAAVGHQLGVNEIAAVAVSFTVSTASVGSPAVHCSYLTLLTAMSTLAVVQPGALLLLWAFWSL